MRKHVRIVTSIGMAFFLLMVCPSKGNAEDIGTSSELNILKKLQFSEATLQTEVVTVLPKDVPGSGSAGYSYVTDDIDGDDSRDALFMPVSRSTGSNLSITTQKKYVGIRVTELNSSWPKTVGGNIATCSFGDTTKYILLTPRPGAQPLVVSFQASIGPSLATYTSGLPEPATVAIVDKKTFTAFDSSQRAGLNSTCADINGDGIDEIIVGAGPGVIGRIGIYQRDGVLVGSFVPFGESFKGGILVQGADVNGDGKSEIIYAPQSKRYADIVIADGLTHTTLRSFRAFSTFANGASISVSQGKKRIFVGAPVGAPGNVQVFDLTNGQQLGEDIQTHPQYWKGGVMVRYSHSEDGKDILYSWLGNSYLAYSDYEKKLYGQASGWKYANNTKNEKFSGAIFSAEGKVLKNISGILPGSSIVVADVDGDNTPEIISGSPPGKPAAFTVYTRSGSKIRTIVLEGKSTKGVNVSIGKSSASADVEIIITQRFGSVPIVRRYTPLGRLLGQFEAYAKTFRGGVQTTVGDIDGDGQNEIVTAPGPGNESRIKLYTFTGKLIRSMDVDTSGFEYYEEEVGISVHALPDLNGDGGMELGIHNYLDSMKIYTTKTVTGKVSYDPTKTYTRNVLESTETPASLTFYSWLFWGQASSSATTIIEGEPHFVMAIPESFGAIVYTSGEHSENAFMPYSSKWKGGVTASAIDMNGDGIMEYVVVPGSIFDTQELLLSFDTTRPSILPVTQPYKFQRLSLSTSIGSVAVNVLTTNLKNPHNLVWTLNALTGAGKPRTNPMSQYIRRIPGAVAGLNGVGPYSKYGGARSVWYDSLHGAFAGYEAGGIAVDDEQNFYAVQIPATTSTAALHKAIFKKNTGRNLQALFGEGGVRFGWRDANKNNLHTCKQLGYTRVTQKSQAIVVGFKGRDMYWLSFPAMGCLHAEINAYFGFSLIQGLDSGGAASFYVDRRFVAGPGRDIANAIILRTR